MRWVEALKKWNSEKGGAWCVPKKGSAEHAAVMKIMKGEAEAPKKKVRPVLMGKVREEKAKATVEKVKTTMKKEKIREFLKKALAKRKESKRTFEERYEAAKAKAKKMSEELGSGAGQDYLGDWEIDHADEIAAHKKQKEASSLIEGAKKYLKDISADSRDRLFTGWDEAHEYKKGLGYPTEQMYSFWEKKSGKATTAKEKMAIVAVKAAVKALEFDATWDGKPQKAILIEDYNKII